MAAYEEVEKLLKRFKCKLLRAKRHRIYLLPTGQHYTTPNTPSDNNAWDNCLADLKVALGISRQGKRQKAPRPTAPRSKSRAVVAKPKEPVVISPAPVGFSFKEKMRAAVLGEKLAHPEPPAKILRQKEKPRERFRAPRSTERGRNGAVRMWSREEIEAANIAMRVGKLTDFMHQHYAASHETANINQPTEESTMLAVEQIDTTIGELEEGMKAALAVAATEEANIRHLESEIEQSKLRMSAAHDKNNSLNDVKTNLAVIRGDIERVRPMLGLLAQKKPSSNYSNKGQKTISAMGRTIRDVLNGIFDVEPEPLRLPDILARINSVPGFEHYTKAAMCAFLHAETKRNGDAMVRRVGTGLFQQAARARELVPA